MDTSTSTNKEEVAKKSPYDDLSREDLIKKCKGLLTIAQKAKQAKQELQTEIEHYKEQLDQSLKEKAKDGDSLRTLQELVESLTEQKLTYITDLDAANNRHAALATKLEEAHKKVQECENKIAELSARTSELDIEVVSLRRQNHRLETENEELIGQLGQLEAEANEQRKQLQMLEESVDRGSPNIADECQQKIDELNKNVSSLEKDLELGAEKTFANEQQIKDLSEKLSEETKKYETEREKKEKANTRLKSYREKLVKCSSSITQLKNSKLILLKTVKDYSESIPKWQDEMVKVSKMLSDQFHKITIENNNIKQQILNYEDKLILTNNNLESLQKENCDLQNKNKELISAIESLKIENTSRNDSEQLNLQIKALESEKLILVKEKHTARESLIELENINQKLSFDLKSLHTNLATLESRINFLECENTSLKNQLSEKDTKECKELKEKLKLLQEQLDTLKTENTTISDLNNILKEEVETLKTSLERPTEEGENLTELNVSLQTDIMKLEKKLAAYKQENSSLLSDMKEMRAKMKELNANSTELEEIKAKMIGYKTENAELLNEMKEVNQVLKERGESISKQEKAIVEMERLIETLEKERESGGESKSELESRVKKLEQEISNLNMEKNKQVDELNKVTIEQETLKMALEIKDALVSSLKEEIEKLKAQLNMSMDQPNEDMSTSTISRAEDHARMKELDETFEDKYTKLRIFALKLKKKANELTQQLQASEAEKIRLDKLLSESEAAAKNVHIIQQEYEKSLNKSEEQMIEIEKLKAELNAVSNPEKLVVVAEPVETADAKKPNARVEGSKVDDTVKELQEKIKELTNELEVQRMKDVSSEIEKLKNELATKESELSAELEQHKTTKDSLEKARRDVKKKSVLSLEMEDYERSMKELSTKMEDNKKKMVNMESTIDSQQGTITSLKTQIKLLEDQIKSEENQNRLTKEELHECTEALKEKDSLVQAKNELIIKLEQDIENGKRSYEELNVEMTGMLGEKEKVILSLSQDKAELGSRLKRVECRCSELEESLRVTHIELEDLKTEFSSYKVRAQAVLRQNQTVDHSAEDRHKEELAATRAQLDTLQAQLQATKSELSELQSLHSAERRRGVEAASEAARATQRTERLRADLQRLTQQLETERAQNKLQVATLTQCYKSEMSELQTRLEREVAELQGELERTRGEDGRRQGREESDLELQLNVSMLTREEGEGSEAAPSPPLSKSFSTIVGPTGGSRSPVPLERLLEEGVPEDDATDGTSLGLTAEQELQDLRRKLQAQVQRVEHVTLLLAESERECARHSQLAELLKAEVRRARGAQQAHNTQYMKNVTLKFLTLPAGDERSRLVPVLQKILTLSNEETHVLHAVAKGQDPNAKGGWGSYLPWTSK